MSRRKSQSAAPAVQVVEIKPKIKVKKQKKKKTSALTKAQPPTPYLRMVVDPMYAPHERAFKPDSNTQPTVMWREPESFLASTDAQGNFWCIVRPAYVAGMAVSYTLTAAGLASGANNVANVPVNLTEVTAAFSSYRPIALTAIIEYVGRSDECQGVLFGAVSTGGPSIDSTQGPGMLQDELYYTECPAEEGEVAVKLIDFSGNAFTAMGSAASTDPTEYIHLGVIGGPASKTNYFKVRFVFIFEAVAAHNKLMSRQQTVSHCNCIETSVAANLVGRPAVVSAGKDAYAKLVEHGTKIVNTASALHGLAKTAAPILESLTGFFV